jgi:hypothetical protein
MLSQLVDHGHIRHQIVIAAQKALDMECGASRGVGISSARGQHA